MLAKTRFRDPDNAKRVAGRIRAIARDKGSIKICHVCGTHEWTITHYGLRSLLPANLELIAGPGCPVCIVPASEIDEAIQLAQKGIVVTCFGDLMRVPGSKLSLSDSKAEGADVRVVYSTSDAIRMAKNETEKEFAFFAVGFETTAPSTAVEILKKPPKSLSFLISHRVIPPAMQLLCEMKDLNLDGLIAPGHVSTIIGLEPYRVIPERYGVPVVVTGFEPLDILFSVYMILKQLDKHKPMLENEYSRVVTREGNVKAQELIQRVFRIENGRWRGLGTIELSKYALDSQHEVWDSRLKYSIEARQGVDMQPGCRCHLIIIGKAKPNECPLFMNICSPQNPVGACMVGNEGTCRIWAKTLSRRGY